MSVHSKPEAVTSGARIAESEGDTNLTDRRARWQAGALDGGSLSPELRDELSRRTRSGEFAELLRSLG